MVLCVFVNRETLVSVTTAAMLQSLNFAINYEEELKELLRDSFNFSLTFFCSAVEFLGLLFVPVCIAFVLRFLFCAKYTDEYRVKL